MMMIMSVCVFMCVCQFECVYVHMRVCVGTSVRILLSPHVQQVHACIIR